MSTREIEIYDESYDGFGDLSGNQYRGVSFGSMGNVTVGGGTIGIQQNKPAATGQAVQVRHHGITRAVVNGSGTPIAIGSPLFFSSGNPGVVATVGLIASGTALQASTTNGDVIAMLLTGPFRLHA
jgi:hypothetical protein